MTQANVMPIVSVNPVDASREFYVEKLGFDHQMGVLGSDGTLDFCSVSRDGGRIMFTRAESPVSGSPNAQFYFQDKDVEAYYLHLKNAGLEPSPLEDMWWGDRVTIVVDNNGYRLWFYQPFGDPQPPAGMKIV